MEFPKFLLADNSEYSDRIFVLHTEYPRFLLDVTTDDTEWFDSIEEENEADAEAAIEELLKQAISFFDKEMNEIESDIE